MFGLLFDLDGTLAATDAVHERAWREVLMPHHVALDADGYERLIRGRTNDAIVAALLPKLSAPEQASVIARKEHSFRSQVNKLEPTPGTKELLQRAGREGWSLGVVTNAPEANAEHLLGILGLRDAFAVVISAEQVSRGKPDPEPYQRALQALGLTATEAVAFEDSPAGVQSAVAAKLRVAGILTGHTPRELLEAGAELVTPSFATAEFQAWLEQCLS